MKNVASLFFATGAVMALIGMGWGIQMSASQNHSLSPAHGHLNLIGFVVMSVYGAYYALTPRAAASRLAQVHYALALAGVVVIVPGIVMALTERGETLAKIGSVLTILSMAVFAFTAIRHGAGSQEAGGRRPMAQPAE